MQYFNVLEIGQFWYRNYYEMGCIPYATKRNQ